MAELAIAREQGIEGSVEGWGGPTEWSVKADSLADGMDPGVGSSGGMGHCSAAKQALQNSLEFALDRAPGGLALPPDKAGAVIVQRGEVGPAHRAGIYPGRAPRASYATACHN